MLSSKLKHKLSVMLVSDHLEELNCDYEINESDDVYKSYDIELLDVGKRIKVFSNFSKLNEISLLGDFEYEDGVLYMVVTPTDKNDLFYVSSGGSKYVMDQFSRIKSSKKIGMKRKYVDVSKLGMTGLKRFVTSH